MFKEFDTVKTLGPIGKLEAGAVGVVVRVHTRPELAYLVEFCNERGETLELVSLLPSQLVAVTPQRAAA